MAAALLCATMSLMSSGLFAQADYSEWERDLLATVMKDSTSRVIAFLPDRYSFGVRVQEGGRLLLVKDGDFNRLLMEGTHRTYEIGMENGAPRVQRIDSTQFHGDNYEMIAFRRKDTLYQYGGYGNWVLRDFLTRYRETSHDWEYVRTNGRPLENRWTPFQYVPEEDKLYVFGSETIDHRDLSRSTTDSVFSFDFQTRSWDRHRAIRNEDSILPHTSHMGPFFCSFGKGVLFTYEGRLYLSDLSKGIYARIGSTVEDGQMARAVGPRTSTDSTLRLVLSDTLHEFFLEGGISRHAIRHIRFDSVMRNGAKELQASTGGSDLLSVSAMLALSLGAGGWMLFVMRRRKMSSATAASGASTDLAHPGYREEEVRGMGLGNHAPPLDRILSKARNHLSKAEWNLLLELVDVSSQGGWMNAESVNLHLGISDKRPEIQKSRRNVSFTNINRVFEGLGLDGDQMIIHERGERDKRSFKYRIGRERAIAMKRSIDAASS